MSSVPPHMRQPTGYVTRSHVKFDHKDFENRKNNKNPLIKGPTDAETARVLDHNILWAVKPTYTLGRKQRPQLHEEPAAFSVLNGIGDNMKSKYEWFRRHRFVGLATKSMDAHAVRPNKRTIRVAIDLKGLTWMENNSSETIPSGAIVMADIPNNTEEAERLLEAVPAEGGIPPKRHIGFPRVYEPEAVFKGIADDLVHVLRRQIPMNRPGYPSTTEEVKNIRRMALLGVCLEHGLFRPQAQGRQIRSTEQFMATLRDLALNNAEFKTSIKHVMGGQADSAIAALIMPTDKERVIAEAEVPSGTQPEILAIHHVQMIGFKNMFKTVEQSLNEAGRNRIIGRSTTTASPGDTFGIILYG